VVMDLLLRGKREHWELSVIGACEKGNADDA
jgi:hypothetical protein